MEFHFNNYSIAPIHKKDAWRLCDFMISNTERLKQDFPGTLRQNQTPTLSEHFVQDKTKSFQNKTEYLFTVKENTDRAIIGLIYIKELGKVPGQGELAYCIGHQYEGKSLTTKSVTQIIAWAFNNLNLHTLQILAHETNTASIRVAEKNGFAFKKLIKNSHTRYSGEVVDMRLYERYVAKSPT